MNLRHSAIAVLRILLFGSVISALSLRADDAPADAEAAVDRASAVIIDLKTNYNGGLAVDFDKNSRWPWKYVPRFRQTFANVPVDIGGRILLWGERNQTVNNQIFPDKAEGIVIGRKFETLYHCTFFQAEPGTAVYDVVFRYADGTSAQDDIRYGDDVRDWYGHRDEDPFGPTAKRSVLAWDGDSFIVSGMDGRRVQPLRFFITGVDNPHPDREVKTIDFVTRKSTAAGCILGLTAGKATLMRK